MAKRTPIVLLLCALASPAGAQVVDIEVPTLILDVGEGDEGGDDAIDLDNVVQTAAKGVTTIQEAPAIVTVVTDRDISDRGDALLEDSMDMVPGWLRNDAIHNQFPFVLTRGTLQAMLYMHNGISLFDPMLNVPQVGRMMPVELIKRVELVTGPGGVLWGANSYLGIANILTKDAEDVDGVEAQISYGDGNGDRGVYKGYVMAGDPELFDNDDLSLFVHTHFESWEGEGFDMPQLDFATPLPFPNSQTVYGPLTRSQQGRSKYLLFSGKLGYKSLKLAWMAPFFVERRMPLGFPGVVSVEGLPEDTIAECNPAEPLYDEFGQRRPGSFGNDACVDMYDLNRVNIEQFYDRYVTADWRTRFMSGKAGATVKLYGVQFVRAYDNLKIFAPSSLLEGGLSFRFDFTGYRAGIIYDGDFELGRNVRLLYGGEMFREWNPVNTDSSLTRQGEGSYAFAVAPYDMSRLPLPCPIKPHPDQMENPGASLFVQDCPLTFAFKAERVVMGAYVNPQLHAGKRLTLDAGVRVQAAPESLGTIGYDPQFIFSGAAVINLAKNYYAKLNYAQGFRPPVFNNVVSNGESIQLDGGDDLQIERSDAFQGEINGRLFKGKREVRELSFRADYAYTRLFDLIQIQSGQYTNTLPRGIHTAEFLAKLYFKGGHRFELSYSWMKLDTEDKGTLVAVPDHWFRIAGIFNLIDGRLIGTTTVRITGAMEDPNRFVEYRGLSNFGDQVFTQPHDVVLDRLPPGGELQVGLTCFRCLDWMGVPDVRLRAFAYNAFNARHYNADGFHDYEPRLEFLPNPYPDFRFLVSLAYAPE